jgi:hypothetical protein
MVDANEAVGCVAYALNEVIAISFSAFLAFSFAKIAHAGSSDLSVITRLGEKLATEEQRECSATVNR